MRKFSTFVVEAARQTLYHGTSLDNVHKILKAGRIEPSDSGHVSTSRDHRYVRSGHGEEAMFHINHDTLRHNSKVTPTDWDNGGSVHDRHHEDALRDSTHRRAESEEAVKGHVDLKHVSKLTVAKKHYHELTRPETDDEKQIAADAKSDPDSSWLFKGMHYEDRVKRSDKFHANLKKHGISLEIK